MIIPAAAYRIQFSEKYPFEELQLSLDYLQKLGISTIYASPIFRARKGSTHGYDVLDPYNINPEIGTLEIFRQILDSLKQHNMNWLQDIVPNHMAFCAENPWLKDIFELGPGSEYYRFFDIDWNDSGKLMVPVLGAPLEEILKKEELKLQVMGNEIRFLYFEHYFPASTSSYPDILRKAGIGNWQKKFEEFSGNDMQWEDLKTGFFREVQEDKELQEGIRIAVEEINSSSVKLRQLLELQYFELVPWQRTDQQINYRRFFTINDLICLNMQDPKVFETYHYYLKELCDLGLITGLRIDHIDGLFNPSDYIRELRRFLKEDLYLVVEKIQETEEQLPGDWPVQGSTGYDFLAQVNHLFIQQENGQQFSAAYKEIAPDLPRYEDLVFQKKQWILKEKMAGELENLFRLFKEYQLLPETKDHLEDDFREALSLLLASFPIYRIYPEAFPLSDSEKEIIETAFSEALRQAPEKAQRLTILRDIFLGEAENEPERMLSFLQRCQQFTGPLAAKGVEDTTFYIYNRLISINEVGDSPENFGMGVEEFHEKMKLRQKIYPLSLNATATHDTKRGEDARMRLNVLSEIPQEWFEKFKEWQKLNESFKTDKLVPDSNAEYFIYQSLLGAFPFEENELEEFPTRVKDYLQKAFREAKVYTDWSNPDEEYESGISNYISAVLEHQEFTQAFEGFKNKVAFYGAIKSLGQTLIKTTAPGIPDIYQGTELWDLSFVDPDNRRPVNYGRRKMYVSDFRSFEKDNFKEELNYLRADYKNGKIKMYLLHRALHFRQEHADLFQKGEYLPLQVWGKHSNSFIAYSRKLKNKWALVVVPVLVTSIFKPEDFVPQKTIVEDLEIILPEDGPKNWRNCLTGAEIAAGENLKLRDLLTDFPVALLTNTEGNGN